MNLDRDLAAALRRKSPPPGFSERVVERISGAGPSGRTIIRRRAFRGAMAAGLALVIASGIWFQQEREMRIERAEGEAAKKLALLALHIASEKANLARDQVRHAGTHSTTKGTNNETTVNP